ncbi:MAG TPA: hypothetical protein DHV62_06755 [Elusimicrobia bacterium]|nr:hypothetical protein [Elusimicrobiota bacterium]
MSQVKEQTSGSCPLPDKGLYDVEIVIANDKYSSSGDPMISIKLNIVSGVFQDSWVWDNILIPPLSSPAAAILGRTKKFLHCIGEPYEGEEVEWDSERWLYKKCKIRIDHEPANQYHKYTKAIVAEYILGEEEPQEEQPF